MKPVQTAALIPILLATPFLCRGIADRNAGGAENSPSAGDPQVIRLPRPTTDGGAALTRSLAIRRSVRSFTAAPLTLADVGQLLWAAQGITRPAPAPAGWRGEWRGGLRTAPSAGALYPLELYLLASRVQGVDAGLYHYDPRAHALVPVGAADPGALAAAALGQRDIAEAPAVAVVTGVYERTAAKYGERAPRYVHIEAGAAAENLLLQAAALGLGGVFVGAFRDDAVRSALGLPPDHAPLGLLPVGYPRNNP